MGFYLRKMIILSINLHFLIYFYLLLQPDLNEENQIGNSSGNIEKDFKKKFCRIGNSINFAALLKNK